MFKKIEDKIYDFFTVLDTSQALILLFSEVVLGIFLSFFSMYIFTKLAVNVLNNSYLNFDVAISQVLYALRSSFLTSTMMFVSFLGKDPIILLSLFIVIYLVGKKYKHEAYLFLFAVIVGFFLNIFLKFFIARPRPFFHPLISESFYGFPSGHTMNSFIFYGMLAFFIFRFTRNKKVSILVSLICILLIVLIGVSRVYLGVHYPSDVLAGMVAGFWWLVTVILVEKTVRFYRLFKIIGRKN